MHEWNPSRPRQPQATAPEESAERRSGRLEWWYRLTAPAEPAGPLNRTAREKARRARLASTLLLLLSLVWLVAIPIYFATLWSNPATLPVAVGGVLVIALLLFLNRRGWVAAVVWLFIGVIYWSVIRSLVQHGHLESQEVAVFDLLIYAELLAVSLLPVLTVFLVALMNCAVILGAIFFLSPSPDAVMPSAVVSNLLVEPLTLQVFVAVVTYLWVRSTERALARAETAELEAALEHHKMEERRQLEGDIQQLLETLTRVANGETSARVTLSQDRTLWQVGRALNTFLARRHHAGQDARVIEQTKAEVAVVAAVLREARAGHRSRLPLPSGGVLDPILKELTSPRSASAPDLPTAHPPWESGGTSGSMPRPRPTEE